MVPFDELVKFHRKRAEILLCSGVDFLAWETVPAVAEVCAIVEVMKHLPQSALAWVSVATQDGQTTAYGEPLHQVIALLRDCDKVNLCSVSLNLSFILNARFLL